MCTYISYVVKVVVVSINLAENDGEVMYKAII